MAAKVVKQLAGDGSGQSLSDMVTALKHTVSGAQLAKVICKATTEELMPPKNKHLDTLVRCTFQRQVPIVDFSNILLSRTKHSNIVVAFKAFITVHHMMQFGHERFFQYIASNNCRFNVLCLNERTNFQGHGIRVFIQVYANYLEEKALSYRELARDLCRLKIGKEGDARTMPQDKLFKMIPVIERSLEALIKFDATSTELANALLRVAHLHLYRDLIHLSAVHNEAMINLIGRYFTMPKKDCQLALTWYKSFVDRLPLLNNFIKIAESSDKGLQSFDGECTVFKPIPSSVLEALEQHLAFLKNPSKPPTSSIPSGSSTSSLNKQLENGSTAGRGKCASTGGNQDGSTATITLTEEERNRIIDEERARLESFVCSAQQKALIDDTRTAKDELLFDDDFIEQMCAKSDKKTSASLNEVSAVYADARGQSEWATGKIGTTLPSSSSTDPWHMATSPGLTAQGVPAAAAGATNEPVNFDPFSPVQSNSFVLSPAVGTAAVASGTNPFVPSFAPAATSHVLVPTSSFPNGSNTHWQTPIPATCMVPFNHSQAPAPSVSLDDRLAQLAGDLAISPVQRHAENSTAVDWSRTAAQQTFARSPATVGGTGTMRASSSMNQLTGPVVRPAVGVTSSWHYPTPASFQYPPGLQPTGATSFSLNPWIPTSTPPTAWPSNQPANAVRSTNPFL